MKTAFLSFPAVFDFQKGIHVQLSFSSGFNDFFIVQPHSSFPVQYFSIILKPSSLSLSLDAHHRIGDLRTKFH